MEKGNNIPEEKLPYCTDCGNDKLSYLDQYANGEYWKCKECGKEFIWKLQKESSC